MLMNPPYLPFTKLDANLKTKKEKTIPKQKLTYTCSRWVTGTFIQLKEILTLS